jgi:hypothetical protein
MRILFIFCIIQVGGFQYSLNTLVNVTVSLLKHHHSTCVYLLHSRHQQGKCFVLSLIHDRLGYHITVSQLCERKLSNHSKL